MRCMSQIIPNFFQHSEFIYGRHSPKRYGNLHILSSNQDPNLCRDRIIFNYIFSFPKTAVMV